MNVNDFIHKINNSSFTLNGNPMRVRVIDDPIMDAYTFAFLYECPETRTIHRDMFSAPHTIFDNDEVLNIEFARMSKRFTDRIEAWEEQGDYELDEIEI